MIKIKICIFIKIVFLIISERIFFHHLERDGYDLDMLTLLIIQINNNLLLIYKNVNICKFS